MNLKSWEIKTETNNGAILYYFTKAKNPYLAVQKLANKSSDFRFTAESEGITITVKRI